MASFAEELSKLTNPTPKFHDPEDDIDDETSARVVTGLSYAEDDASVSQVTQTSRLRRQALPLLAESDHKYQGRTATRKSLIDQDEEPSDDDLLEHTSFEGTASSGDSDEEKVESEESSGKENNSSSDDDEIDISAFKQQLKLKTSSGGKEKGFQFNDDGDYGKYGDISDDMDQGEATDDSEGEPSDRNGPDNTRGEDSDRNSSDSGVEDDGMGDGDVSKFSKTDLSEEIEKGKAAKSQISLWDSLLEGRIKLQKSVSLANQLPQPQIWPAFQEEGGDNFAEMSAQCQQAVKTLLDTLTQLQTLLLNNNSETKHVVEGGDQDSNSSKPVDSDDEEITSESETEDKPTQSVKSPSIKSKQHRKRKLKTDDYPEFLAKRHTEFEPFRSSTIQKWSDKTRLATGKIKSKSFSAFEQSALKQIQQIMADKERLVRRTQLKRTVYKILGNEESPESVDRPDPANQDTEHMESIKPEIHNHDPEIFDDDDFYHQLLRELIERKTSDISDPVALSRQWLEIQRLRTKVKKKVDTKASKGRKLRYDIHKKLINFMAPVDHSTWTDESRDDLYRSLFGKRFNSVQPEIGSR